MDKRKVGAVRFPLGLRFVKRGVYASVSLCGEANGVQAILVEFGMGALRFVDGRQVRDPTLGL